MGVDFNATSVTKKSCNSDVHILLPESIEFNAVAEDQCDFSFKQLEKGFGITIGNAYRRTLISSVPGFAISGVKIPGVKHEFDSIPGVQQDMINLILNLKQLRVKAKVGSTEKSEKISVHVENMSSVSVKDILRNSHYFEPVNPNFIIFDVDPKVTLDFEVFVEEGFGFILGDQQKNLPEGEGFIGIDAIFSPVKNVRMFVEEETEWENLTLSITTDGAIAPKVALEEASKLLVAAFSLGLGNAEAPVEAKQETIFSVNESIFEVHKLLMTPICNSSVNLSVRACNCLKSANISTLGDLVSKTEEELMELKNFGKKSLKELKTLLEKNNLTFGMDLSDFKIYKNN